MNRLCRVCENDSDYVDESDYVFDNIGNRLSTTNNGSSTSYTANQLNQYTNVNGSVPTYDADGNMLTNGDWTYTWNGENRLISASNGTTVVSFAYDYMGRRFAKSSGGDTTTFVYDGWNMVRESSLTETNHYVWGLDLSGMLQGAGGVGGLLAVTENDGSVYFPVADANGNITGYIDDSGNVEAVYVFDAFGNVLTSSGDKADDFKFRFSSKYQDSETSFNYYGLRYYDAGDGRWLNRDPIGERGGLNLYQFVYNSPLIFVDPSGLASFEGFSDKDDYVYKLKVGECEVAIFYGHGSLEAPHELEFEGDGSCNAASFSGCGERLTNQKIPASQRVNQSTGTAGKKNTKMSTDGSPTTEGEAVSWHDKALKKAYEICVKSKCECEEVSIEYVFVPHNTEEGRKKDKLLGVGNLHEPYNWRSQNRRGNETVYCGNQ